MSDQLTGLPTRHQLHLQLPEYAAQATAAQPLALLLLSLRDFPLWQARLTPLAADALLQLAADSLGRAAPAGCFAARWDHARFGLLLPDCPLWRAEDVGESLRLELRRSSLPTVFQMQNLQPDFCIGAAILPPLDPAGLTLAAERQLRRSEGGDFASLLQRDPTGPPLPPDQAEAYIRLAETFLIHGDPYLCRQGRLTAGFAAEVGRKLGFSEDVLAELRLAAAFADIAMAEAAGSALNKPGTLTLGEFNRIKRHPAYAAELTRSLGLSQGVSDCVRFHHAYCDGSGYPEEVGGSQIPLAASVLGACSAYAAMLLPRPYRPARRPYQAKAEIARAANTLWPRQVVMEVVAL